LQQLQHFIDPIDPKHETFVPAGSQQNNHNPKVQVQVLAKDNVCTLFDQICQSEVQADKSKLKAS